MRKLQFKFPSQIRISGWDFGSSARAMNQAGGKDSLMTYESVSKTQADVRKGRISTTERKSMSTKTSIKRIALVAVAALGLGMVSTVAANATRTITGLSAGVSTPARVGSTASVTITATHAAASSDTFTAAAKITSAPAASLLLTATSSSSTGVSLAAGTNTSIANNAYGSNTGNTYATITQGTSSATSSSFVLNFVADAPGTYQVLVSTGNNTYTAGDQSVVVTFTTVGAPTSITLASVAGVVVDGGTKGQLFSMSLKDAAGNPTVLGPNEGITISEADADLKIVGLADTSSSTAITAFGNNDTNLSKGVYYFRAVDAASPADGTAVITVAGNGLLASSLTSNISATKVTVVAPQSGDKVDVTTSKYYVTTGTPALSATYGTTQSTHGFTVTLAAKYQVSSVDADSVYLVKVTPATAALAYDTTVSVAAGKLTGTFSVSSAVAATDTAALKVKFGSASTTTGGASVTSGEILISYQKPYTTTLAVVSQTPVLSATGGKTTWIVKATDQYTAAKPYVPVTVSVSGRNTVSSLSLGVTDANGFITYSLTDAGTSGSADSLTFATTDTNNAGSAVSSVSGTVNYGTVTVGTVAIKGGNNTTSGVAATSVQWKDINAGVDGASSTTHSITATVKDANGNLVAGVPVTFSVSGTGAAIPSTLVTVNTGSAGTATSAVYAWIAGKYTVTATAGGKTGTSDYQFRQSGSGEERAISASVSGNLVTAKVVDRFGNPVPAVTVYASVTGGYLGTGTLKTSDSTDNDGLVSFIVNGGASNVTVATYNAATASAPYGSGQTCARAGASDCNILAADDTAFTASVAGTSTVDETGVGASFAAAGVASASVDVAAAGASDSVDAANEATDAANAATDAANAAAEAADAATAAAQDAQAAVAALATSVASLIAGIKAQITTLTNLVIKIQKKVKA